MGREKELLRTSDKGGGVILKILIVDDECRMRKLIKDFLVHAGYEVVEADNGKMAIDIFERENVDLIILDVMMPVLDGWEASKVIRKKSDVPIVLLTARSEAVDELHGFSLGIDEYITKPFSPKVLVARIEAILKRVGAKEDVINIDDIILDRRQHLVKVKGERVDLSYREYELLSYFMNNCDIALSRERIFSEVWKYDYIGDARTIDTHIKKLRSKLGEKSELIRTVWGFGYKFSAS